MAYPKEIDTNVRASAREIRKVVESATRGARMNERMIVFIQDGTIEVAKGYATKTFRKAQTARPEVIGFCRFMTDRNPAEIDDTVIGVIERMESALLSHYN